MVKAIYKRTERVRLKEGWIPFRSLNTSRCSVSMPFDRFVRIETAFCSRFEVSVCDGHLSEFFLMNIYISWCAMNSHLVPTKGPSTLHINPRHLFFQ